MVTAVSKYWWVLLLRGILAILFGLAIWLMPGMTLVILVTIFGAYALVDGAMAIFLSFSSRNTDKDWGKHLIEGILGVIFGVLVLTWPELAVVTSSITILVLIAFWAISTGVLQIISAIQLRKEIDNEFWLGLSGLISVIFGFVILRFPLGSALALTWLIGVYSVVFGVFFIMLAFRVRGLGSTSAPA
jgi:uncharacterized membrane protein HdeD (DUF308 family)